MLAHLKIPILTSVFGFIYHFDLIVAVLTSLAIILVNDDDVILIRLGSERGRNKKLRL